MAKIMLAWDKSSLTGADQEVLHSLSGFIDGVKIGLEAMTAQPDNLWSGYIGHEALGLVTDELKLPVMWDAKLHDIGNTATAATKNTVVEKGAKLKEAARRVDMLTFHTTMSDNGIASVVKICAEAGTLALGVTVLTDLDEAQCRLRYGGTPAEVVPRLIANAKQFGLKGLVCSAQELRVLAEGGLIDDVTTVIPGTRPTWAAANDQARVMTPAEAVRLGADWLVVGRPILQPPSGMTPAQAAERLREEIA